MATMKELKANGEKSGGTPSTAVEVVANAEVDTISALIGKIGSTVDSDKAVVATAMLNTFLLAVKRIGGRATFTERDFMAFGIALAAVNQVQPGERQRAGSAGLEALHDELVGDSLR